MSKNFWTSLFFVYGVCVCVHAHLYARVYTFTHA